MTAEGNTRQGERQARRRAPARPKGRAKAQAPDRTLLLRALAREARERADLGPVAVALFALLEVCPDLGRDLGRLLAHDPDDDVAEGAADLLLLSSTSGALTARRRLRLLEQVVAEAERVLDAPRVSDDRKLRVAAALELIGSPLSEQRIVRSLAHPEQAFARWTSRRVAGLADTVADAEGFLLDTALFDEQGVLASLSSVELERELELARTLAGSSPHLAATLAVFCALAALERGHEVRVVARCLDEAATCGPARAAWFLEQLARWPGMGGAGLRARALARRLRGQATQPSAPGAPPCVAAAVSSLDALGTQSIVFRFGGPEDDEAAHDGLRVILREGAPAELLYLPGLGATLHEQLLTAGGAVYAVAPGFAQRLLADALVEAEARDERPPARLALYAALLPGPLLARAWRPARSRLRGGTRAADPVARSHGLLADPAYGGGLWGEAAYAFVAERRRRGEARVCARPTAALVAAFLDAVEASERAPLVRRLLRNASLAREARTSGAGDRIAARTGFALQDQAVPFAEVPYVRGLAAQAIPHIARNLARGFPSEAAARIGPVRRRPMPR